MESKDGGVCYDVGLPVKHGYQMCDVTNPKILDILEGKQPQVTFACHKTDNGTDICDFQCTWRRMGSALTLSGSQC
jgi:hypothetical protein